MIVASFVNIGLDLLFVLVFHWGIAGAAAATIIAQGLSAVYCGIRVSKIEILRLTRSHFKLDLRLSGRLFSLGSPMALQNGIIAVGGLIVQMVVNTWGVIFIAGYTATNKLFGILEIAATSYGYAMVTYVGQNLGAGNISRIKKVSAPPMVWDLPLRWLFPQLCCCLENFCLACFCPAIRLTYRQPCLLHMSI